MNPFFAQGFYVSFVREGSTAQTVIRWLLGILLVVYFSWVIWCMICDLIAYLRKDKDVK